MTVKELHDLLIELVDDEHFATTEVRMTYQPNWPLQSHIKGVYVPDCNDDPRTNAIFIVDGGQVYETPYGPKEAWEDCIK